MVATSNKNSDMNTITVQFKPQNLRTDKEEQNSITERKFVVPVELGPMGLQRIITSIIKTKGIDYDFYNDNKLISGTIKSFLEEKSFLNKRVKKNSDIMGSEKIMELIYTPKFLPPTYRNNNQREWVSCVKSLIINQTPQFIFGDYNGILSLTNIDLNLNKSIQIEGKSKVTGLSIIKQSNTNTNDDYIIAHCSENGLLNITQYNQSKNSLSLSTQIRINSSPQTITTFKNLICLGDFEGNLHFYDYYDNNAMKNDDKKELNKINGIEKAHFQQISAICWPFESNLYSGSWDNKIKNWDVKKSTEITKWKTENIITNMDYNLITNLAISSHCGGEINFWDFRQTNNNQNGQIARRKCSNWISTIKWKENYNSNLFVSGDYEGKITFWDLRREGIINQLDIFDKNGKILDFDFVETDLINNGVICCGQKGLTLCL